jgi:hypothetical protein
MRYTLFCTAVQRSTRAALSARLTALRRAGLQRHLEMEAMRGSGLVTSGRGVFGDRMARTRVARPPPLLLTTSQRTVTRTSPAVGVVHAEGASVEASNVDAYVGPSCSPSSACTPSPQIDGRWESAAWFDASLLRSKEFVCGTLNTGAARGSGKAAEEVGTEPMYLAGHTAPLQVSAQVGYTIEDHCGRLAMETLLANMYQVNMLIRQSPTFT